MNQKNVWVINQFAGTPESGWGERHYYFARYWKQKGYNVRIISSSYNHMFRKNVEVNRLYKHENFQGIDFYWVQTPKYDPRSVKRFWSMLIFAYRVLRLPIDLLGKPSTIIVSSMPIFPIYSGLVLKRKYRAKLLFEIRDIWPLTLQLLGGYSRYHPAVLFIGWFEKIGYRNADYVVSLLPNAHEHIEQVARKKVKFSYIPNGIDPQALLEEQIEKEIIQLIPKDKFVVGYAGTLGLANALEYLIKAANMLADFNEITFVIVGDGYLKKELENDCISSNVVFIPKIKKNQVQHLLTFFDICFVGRNDTILFKHGVSANKYFDYMLANKPILDSNNHIKDPVELSGCGLIVTPDSADAIKQGILTFYNMPEDDRKKMGQKGKDFVIKQHRIDKLANDYIDLF